MPEYLITFIQRVMWGVTEDTMMTLSCVKAKILSKVIMFEAHICNQSIIIVYFVICHHHQELATHKMVQYNF